MDFDLSEEQTLLKANVERLAESLGRFANTTSRYPSRTTSDREAWSRFAELGLLALPFSPEDGGLGGTSIETMLVAEALGRHLCPLPYVASIVLAGSLLRFGATAEQRRSLVPNIIDGTDIIAFAFQEPGARYDLADVQATAKWSGSQWELVGHKCGVVAGDEARWIIVSARVAGSRFDQDGIGLFLVEAGIPGLSRRSYVAQDGTRGAEIILSNVCVAADAKLDASTKSISVIERAADCAQAANVAECVGLMESMLNITVLYLKTRKQFGKAIAEFQALQHRAADMLVALEQARSMALYAAAMVEHEKAEERRRALAAAKIQVGESLRFIAFNAVQLHGGIGVTEECAIGPLFKRATVLGMYLGDAEHHLARLTEAGGLAELRTAEK
ncbi:acyl-CoA dehydrogenase family protein [Bradyrhizobium sp. 195]|uniref:acyl-CoA dehydrogenase family protein n=1 Tax=Bradyrhizobium sp. 195 TaxID=2782662 RepID=UPI0020008BBC|nr:acyl-CoA dehydrogenase family protein [Bradyrhizobium sp. 195]UPK29949.1 acyl-CoA dehydrogenase family protein [Bradyrhizobium sp. 195]